jgi:hypothetical protein
VELGRQQFLRGVLVADRGRSQRSIAVAPTEVEVEVVAG